MIEETLDDRFHELRDSLKPGMLIKWTEIYEGMPYISGRGLPYTLLLLKDQRRRKEECVWKCLCVKHPVDELDDNPYVTRHKTDTFEYVVFRSDDLIQILA